MTQAATCWYRFEVRGGPVRLGLWVPDGRRDDLLCELRGCAVVSEDLAEFIQLAVRATASHGGVVGEVRPGATARGPGLREGIRRAACEPLVDGAAAVLLDALGGAAGPERRALLYDAGWEAERGFVRDVLVGLDEGAAPVADAVAGVLGVGVGELPDLLGAATDS